MEAQTSKEALLRQVDDLRAQARRARRWARSLDERRDRTAPLTVRTLLRVRTLLTFAQELDEKADRLEKQAANAKSVIPKR